VIEWDNASNNTERDDIEQCNTPKNLLARSGDRFSGIGLSLDHYSRLVTVSAAARPANSVPANEKAAVTNTAHIPLNPLLKAPFVRSQSPRIYQDLSSRWNRRLSHLENLQRQ
jgi:hypothetical protein